MQQPFSNKRIKLVYSFAVAVLIFFSSTAPGLAQTEVGNWRSYGATQASTKYSPLNQITKQNVESLRIAWRWESLDQPILNADAQLWTWKYEATPLMVDGVLYTSTSLSQVAAIDALTGETIWGHNPNSYRLGSPPNNGFLHRGSHIGKMAMTGEFSSGRETPISSRSTQIQANRFPLLETTAGLIWWSGCGATPAALNMASALHL